MVDFFNNIKFVPIDSIYPWDDNPNNMDAFEQESLNSGVEKYGFFGAILVREETREIIDGEHRWRSLKFFHNCKEAPVIFLDVTKEEAIDISIAMNQKRGRFDTEKMSNIIADIVDRGDRDVEEISLATGFRQEEINELYEIKDLSWNDIVEDLEEESNIDIDLEPSKEKTGKDTSGVFKYDFKNKDTVDRLSSQLERLCILVGSDLPEITDMLLYKLENTEDEDIIEYLNKEI